MGHQFAEPGQLLRKSGSHHRSERPVAAAAPVGLAPRLDKLCHVLVERPAAAVPVLHLHRRRVAGLDQRKDPPAVGRCGLQERPDAVTTQVWTDGHGVRNEVRSSRRIPSWHSQVAGCVSGGRARDVASLHVPDDDEAPLTGEAECGGISAHALAAVLLVEGDLTLDGDGMFGDQLYHRPIERRYRICSRCRGPIIPRRRPEFGRQTLHPRVQSDDDLAFLTPDLLHQHVAEVVLGHPVRLRGHETPSGVLRRVDGHVRADYTGRGPAFQRQARGALTGTTARQ